MMNYCKTLMLALALTGAASCSTAPKAPEQASAQRRWSSEVLKDVRYGDFERNVMDVYLPADRSPKTAFVINIHGGAWTQGDRKFDGQLSEYLVSHGIAVVNINYRYANKEDIHLPELLDDVDHVVKYLADHSKEWNTRSSGFSITGGSSGAHVSMMYAYTKNPDIKTIIERCGPVDFTDVETLKYVKAANLFEVLDKMSGNTTVWNPGDAIPAAYARTSPVAHVSKIPILIIHGDKDEVVPIPQAYILEKALKAKGTPYKLVVVPGAGHQIEKKPADQQMEFREMTAWLNKYGIN